MSHNRERNEEHAHLLTIDFIRGTGGAGYVTEEWIWDALNEGRDESTNQRCPELPNLAERIGRSWCTNKSKYASVLLLLCTGKALK